MSVLYLPNEPSAPSSAVSTALTPIPAAEAFWRPIELLQSGIDMIESEGLAFLRVRASHQQ